jgi:hypothetical protein
MFYQFEKYHIDPPNVRQPAANVSNPQSSRNRAQNILGLNRTRNAINDHTASAEVNRYLSAGIVDIGSLTFWQSSVSVLYSLLTPN